jgi:transporter family-2 protein
LGAKSRIIKGMKYLLNLTPALIGIAVVVQAGINRQISTGWGLVPATLLNAFSTLLGAAILFWIAWKIPSVLPEGFGMSGSVGEVFAKHSLWKLLLPGLLGLLIVILGPWGVSKFGAVQTFILVISAQLLSSLAWDMWVENLPVSRARLVGIALTWVGVIVFLRG